MDKALGSMIGNGIQVQLDDILIYGKTGKEHDENLIEVMNKLEKNSLIVNIKKIQFAKTKNNIIMCKDK